MNLLRFSVVLVLLVGVWANINVRQPPCDSPEAEEAAMVAQCYLNSHHTHGYKYALNRIDDIKIYSKPDGDMTYFLEVDLLETDCHVSDPTPVANCTVRPKVLTAVEGDCDVVLNRVGGALTVTAFKCKTEESTEDLCVGCPVLLALNDTNALDFVHASLATYNNRSEKARFIVMEVGRMSSQLVSGGVMYHAEYVVVEANCTGDACVPLSDPMAARGMCSAHGLSAGHKVDCRMFSNMIPAAPALPVVAHQHTYGLSHKHGLNHHKLTTMHDPTLSGLLSTESAESAEDVPVAPVLVVAVADAPAPAADPAPNVDSLSASSSASGSASSEVHMVLVKREAPAVPVLLDTTITLANPVPLVPVCPGRIRFF